MRLVETVKVNAPGSIPHRQGAYARGGGCRHARSPPSPPSAPRPPLGPPDPPSFPLPQPAQPYLAAAPALPRPVSCSARDTTLVSRQLVPDSEPKIHREIIEFLNFAPRPTSIRSWITNRESSARIQCTLVVVSPAGSVTESEGTVYRSRHGHLRSIQTRRIAQSRIRKEQVGHCRHLSRGLM